LRHLFVTISLLAGGLILQTPSAVGSPVLWTLNGVQFSDNSTASGSFVYDADTQALSNIDILYNGLTYNTEASTFLALLPAAFVFIPNETLISGADIPALVLDPASALTDAGGSVGLSGGSAVVCNTDCSSAITNKQLDAGGLVSAVPEPGFAPLLGLVGAAAILSKRAGTKVRSALHRPIGLRG
jgi:hypothetical protein